MYILEAFVGFTRTSYRQTWLIMSRSLSRAPCGVTSHLFLGFSERELLVLSLTIHVAKSSCKYYGMEVSIMESMKRLEALS